MLTGFFINSLLIRMLTDHFRARQNTVAEYHRLNPLTGRRNLFYCV